MKIKIFTILAIATLALAACGLRDSPAVPPAPGQTTPPTPVPSD